MIEFSLSDSLVYNGVKNSFVNFIMKGSGLTISFLKEGIIKEMDKFIPIDTTPAENAEEFIKFLENMENGKEEGSNDLHINTCGAF